MNESYCLRDPQQEKDEARAQRESAQSWWCSQIFPWVSLPLPLESKTDLNSGYFLPNKSCGSHTLGPQRKASREREWFGDPPHLVSFLEPSLAVRRRCNKGDLLCFTDSLKLMFRGKWLLSPSPAEKKIDRLSCRFRMGQLAIRKHFPRQSLGKGLILPPVHSACDTEIGLLGMQQVMGLTPTQGSPGFRVSIFVAAFHLTSSLPPTPSHTPTPLACPCPCQLMDFSLYWEIY